MSRNLPAEVASLILEMSKAVEVENLSFKYKDSPKEALKAVSLAVEEGEFVALMGETGAGKSTLCYALNGLVPKFIKGSFQGKVKIFGQEIEDKKVAELADWVGMVFQDFEPQLFSTNVELEVAFAPQNLGLKASEIAKRVSESLKMVGLDGYEHRSPFTLSGGEKQRLVIASVLAACPPLLVMDEPTSDLDPRGKLEIFSLIKKLSSQMERSMTLFVVEHEPEEMLQANRIIIMKDGNIVSMGEPRNLFAQASLLEEYGIRPLQVTKLFQALGLEEAPLSPEEAYEILSRKDWKIKPEKYEELRSQARHYGEEIIKVNNLDYIYPEGVKALSKINLSMRQGEFIAIIGQNGSGKTTLVKHFNGLLLPTYGSVEVAGRDTKDLKILDLSREVGYVFQNPDHQIFAETVFEEVAFGPRNLGFSEEETKERVAQALKAVGLEGSEKADPFLLTKGERQRVAVASVLATKPKVIIFDEPTTGLDYKQIKNMMDLIKRLNQAGHTIIIITHCLWVAAEYAHRIIALKEGKILLDGPTREALAQEKMLRETNLVPPQIVRLSNMFGRTVLSAEELEWCLT